MNKDKIEKIMSDCDEDIKYVEEISNKIVKEKTKDLDELMAIIQEDVVAVEEPSLEIIEKYFLELTNALYFINARSESLGFYDDISKTNAKMAYNRAYSENQVKNSTNNIKATVADNQLVAEKESLDETLVNIIYSRAYRIIKVKVESANEMVKTLSKLITARLNERQLNTFGSLPNKTGFSGGDE